MIAFYFYDAYWVQKGLVKGVCKIMHVMLKMVVPKDGYH